MRRTQQAWRNSRPLAAVLGVTAVTVGTALALDRLRSRRQDQSDRDQLLAIVHEAEAGQDEIQALVDAVTALASDSDSWSGDLEAVATQAQTLRRRARVMDDTVRRLSWKGRYRPEPAAQINEAIDAIFRTLGELALARTSNVQEALVTAVDKIIDRVVEQMPEGPRRLGREWLAKDAGPGERQIAARQAHIARLREQAAAVQRWWGELITLASLGDNTP